jgi:hypothetical protein
MKASTPRCSRGRLLPLLLATLLAACASPVDRLAPGDCAWSRSGAAGAGQSWGWSCRRDAAGDAAVAIVSAARRAARPAG